jgi:hypothetical protein
MASKEDMGKAIMAVTGKEDMGKVDTIKGDTIKEVTVKVATAKVDIVREVIIKEAMDKGHMGKVVMDKLIMEIILDGIHNLLIIAGVNQITVGEMLKIIMHGVQQIMEVGEEEVIINGEFIAFYSFHSFFSNKLYFIFINEMEKYI